MIEYRSLRLGILLLAAAGCSSQPKSAVTIAPPKVNPFLAKPQTEEPKWDSPIVSAAPGTSGADLLAQKTTAYANQLQMSDPPSKTAEPESASALLNGSSNTRRHHKPAAPAADQTVIAPVIEPPASAPQLASLTISPKLVPTGDDPKIMPESADFASLGTPSKDTLGDRLRKRTRDNPADVSDQLDLQLYGMLNDDPAPELAEVTLLATDDREVVSALVDGLSNFRSAIRQDSHMLQSKKIQPLIEMADRLRSQADLTVSNVTLCRRVDGFGKYDPITPSRFPAGKDNPAIIYCEVENFLPKQNGAIWQTKLSEKVTLYANEDGAEVWNNGSNTVTDECRNRRHDFYAYNIIHLPPTLPVGRYMLKVSVEDQNAGRVSETTIPVSIVAK